MTIPKGVPVSSEAQASFTVEQVTTAKASGVPADATDEDRLVRDLRRFTDEMLGSKIPIDPNDGWKHASDWEPVKARLRTILASYGDARQIAIAIEFDRATLAATWSLYEAGSGRLLREPAEILRVLEGRRW